MSDPAWQSVLATATLQQGDVRRTAAAAGSPVCGDFVPLLSQERLLVSAERLQRLVEATGFASVPVFGTCGQPACPLPLAKAPTPLALGHRPELPC